jgi:hypothetical protein
VKPENNQWSSAPVYNLPYPDSLKQSEVAQVRRTHGLETVRLTQGDLGIEKVRVFSALHKGCILLRFKTRAHLLHSGGVLYPRTEANQATTAAVCPTAI